MFFSPVVSRTKYFVFNLILCSVLWFWSQAVAGASQSVTLAWNPSIDPGIAGYKIYYGTASHNYSSVVTVGITNSVTITGLTAGTTYYFAATSYDQAGVESDLSNEASYAVPAPQPALTATAYSAGQFRFNVSGTTGAMYVVQASTDLVHWVSLQTNAVPFDFVDSQAANFSKRFYRSVPLSTVQAAAVMTPAKLVPTITASGQFSFTLTGNGSQQYVVQASTDLVNWVSVQTNTAPFTFVDTNTAGFPRRFFRTVTLTP